MDKKPDFRRMVDQATDKINELAKHIHRSTLYSTITVRLSSKQLSIQNTSR